MAQQHELTILANRSLQLEHDPDNYYIGRSTHDTDYLRIGDNYHYPDSMGRKYVSRYGAIIGFNHSAVPVRKKIISVEFKMKAKTEARLTRGMTRREVIYDTSDSWDESDNMYNYVEMLNYTELTHTWSILGWSAGVWLSEDFHPDFVTGRHSIAFRNNYDNEATADFYSTRAAEENRPRLIVVYEDVPPSVPEPIDPVGDFIDRQQVIRFIWSYISSVGGVQKKFDLQLSVNQTTWATISQTTPNTFYDMPAGTLPTGNIFWRVRTYNEYDEVSGYSAVSAFYTVGSPAVPVIQSVSTGTARPTVTWTSSGQQIYELRIKQGSNIVYSTGIVPKSGELSHKVKAFLPDGSYTAGVRIKNEYDIYSDWGESAFSVTTSKPGALSIKAYGRPYGAKLMFNSPANYALVYRQAEGEGYICIGKVNAGQTTFDDYTAASGKTYMYFLRNVSTGETYTDSAAVQQIIKLIHTQLAPASDPANVYLLKFNLGAPPAKAEVRSVQQSEMRFEGREYPVYEQNGFKSESLSCAFWVREYADAKAFYERFAKGDIVLLRDGRGRKIYGVLGDISVSEAHPGYTLNFTVTRCDYVEEIEV